MRLLRGRRMRGLPNLIIQPGLFRLLLALAVVVSHISRLDIGRIAVLLFFYLSGYWVALIWQTRFAARGPMAFYASRWLRIMPLYWLVLAALWLTGATVGLPQIALIDIANATSDPLGISWSLGIELQFYLALPFLFSAMAGRGAPLWLAASLCIAAAAWVAAPIWGVTSIAQYLPPFLLGVLTYTKAWRPTDSVANASLAAFAVASVALAVLPVTASFLDKTLADPFDRDIFSFLWMLPLLPYVAASLHRKSTPFDRHLGNLSYPLYLIHYPMIVAFATLGAGPQWRLAAAFAAIIVSIIVYWLADRPFERLRLRLTETPSTPPALPARHH